MSVARQTAANDDTPRIGADCCDSAVFANFLTAQSSPKPINDHVPDCDPSAFVTCDENGEETLGLLVENLHCAACIHKIEGFLLSQEGVTAARVNMSTKRLTVTWRKNEADPQKLIHGVTLLGYPVTPYDPNDFANIKNNEEKRLVSALAVSGFAASNVMLLSVAIWSGHASDMGEGTRTLFHWISALIALPAVAYAGQPFFQSAYKALRSGGANMDVPISLAVILASVMSIQQTMVGAEHAYFDASITLLFFLLIGRYLDQRARAKACSAASHLLGLQAKAATIIEPSGLRRSIRTRDITPGMIIYVAAGESIPVDGDVTDGRSEIDVALITGESMPKLAEPNSQVFAGTVNLTGPLQIQATASADTTLLSEIVRLMETAEQGRAKYVRLADRIARVYAPVVHILAAATFLGWFFLSDTSWQTSLMTSIAVLIITCPCAIGLAVPAVQVVASGRLLQAGVLLKSSDALERLAEIDTIVFDKTGTLTMGQPQLVGGSYNEEAIKLASALADHSRHPLSRALVRAFPSNTSPAFTNIREVPGYGLEAELDGKRIRLGRREWCGVAREVDNNANMEIYLSYGTYMSAQFVFCDTLRPDALETITDLKRSGFKVELLSGDLSSVVEATAKALNIDTWQAECLPAGKVAHLSALADNGHKVLMVGDGLNDAPSLVAAHISMSPANAADVSQVASDLIFQGKELKPVLISIRVARNAIRLVKQNFVLAILYNACAVPLAMAGFVTPLIAAVAMSSSSLAVTLNALRLRILR